MRPSGQRVRMYQPLGAVRTLPAWKALLGVRLLFPLEDCSSKLKHMSSTEPPRNVVSAASHALCLCCACVWSKTDLSAFTAGLHCAGWHMDWIGCQRLLHEQVIYKLLCAAGGEAGNLATGTTFSLYAAVPSSLHMATTGSRHCMVSLPPCRCQQSAVATIPRCLRTDTCLFFPCFCDLCRLKPILKPTDPVAALLSWACIVAVNQYFVLPRSFASASALHSLGQVGVWSSSSSCSSRGSGQSSLKLSSA